MKRLAIPVLLLGCDIRLSTRMRTIDIVEAPRARIRAEIGPKD